MHADKNFYVVVNYFSTHVTLITAVFRSVSRVSATLLIPGCQSQVMAQPGANSFKNSTNPSTKYLA